MRASPLALALLLVALPAPAQDAGHAFATQPLSLVVQGQVATGWVSYPTDVAPTTLLAVAHGCCGALSIGAFNTYAGNVARDFGAAVVAMNYRGNGHWNVWAGHEDTNAAVVWAQARWPIGRTIVWGVSMGGEVSGMAVAARPDLYDYWVDSLGVTDLFQQFAAMPSFPCAGAQCAAPNPANPTRSWILEETGGLPGQVPLEAWVLRSPDLRALEMRGLTRAYLNYHVGDLIVPVSEGLSMFTALQAAGVPASLCLALTRPGGVQGPFTVLTGWPAPLPTPLGLSSHEWGPMCDTFAVRDALLRDEEPDAGLPAALHVRDYTSGLRA